MHLWFWQVISVVHDEGGTRSRDSLIEGKRLSTVQKLPAATDAAREICQDFASFFQAGIRRCIKLKDQQWIRSAGMARARLRRLRSRTGAPHDLTKGNPTNVVRLIWPADISIPVKQDDCQYRFAAMMLDVGEKQRIKDNLAKKLADLHLGNVTHCASRLQRPPDRLLTRPKVESPI
ncbi:hypothetical protein BDZ45DRAFT_777853 [Acephala macrosclerotiorum]|nr:hypothetical protein BDZ45DRAFT_777853 [Acephala macrosclerotiorum]